MHELAPKIFSIKKIANFKIEFSGSSIFNHILLLFWGDDIISFFNFDIAIKAFFNTRLGYLYLPNSD